MTDLGKILGIDDLIADDRVVSPEEILALARKVEENERAGAQHFKNFEVMYKAFAYMQEDFGALKASTFTRQRRRSEVRNILLGLNSWPANKAPRRVRRKQALANVSSYMKSNPIDYEKGR